MDMIRKIKKNIHYYVGLIVLLMGQLAYAETIVIQPNTPISVTKDYQGVTLDLRNGSFVITNGANLSIRDCTVVGRISKNNPVLFDVQAGKLNMRRNIIKLTSSGIDSHPYTQSLYHAVQVANGTVDLRRNSISVEQPMTVGFLISLWTFGTTDFNIVNNTFTGFHGALYMLNSHNANVANNVFSKNTYGNIVAMGDNNKIVGNSIYFSGNNKLGNAIDVLNSSNVIVRKNLLFTPTCHGIYILSSHNVQVDNNRIEGGITYAITVLSFPESSDKFAYLNQIIPANKLIGAESSNQISITNNFMSQNRYGIAATDIRNLTVDGNYFIQRFANDADRKFWTDNKTLLTRVTGLVWTNNFYKEAFTQDISGDNSKSLTIVPFPVTGGVSL